MILCGFSSSQLKSHKSNATKVREDSFKLSHKSDSRDLQKLNKASKVKPYCGKIPKMRIDKL